MKQYPCRCKLGRRSPHIRYHDEQVNCRKNFNMKYVEGIGRYNILYGNFLGPKQKIYRFKPEPIMQSRNPNKTRQKSAAFFAYCKKCGQICRYRSVEMELSFSLLAFSPAFPGNEPSVLEIRTTVFIYKINKLAFISPINTFRIQSPSIDLR